jgi:hypothetical protein
VTKPNLKWLDISDIIPDEQDDDINVVIKAISLFLLVLAVGTAIGLGLYLLIR